MKDFEHLSALELIQDLVRVDAALKVASKPVSSSGPPSEEDHPQVDDLGALAAIERRLVHELRRRALQASTRFPASRQ